MDCKVLYNELFLIECSIINNILLPTMLYLTCTSQDKSLEYFYSRYLRMKL